MKLTHLLVLLTAANLVACADVSDPVLTTGSSVPVTSVPLDGTTTTATTQGYPQQVTLLVPLQGQLADAGQSIRDGFMMAYQNTPENARPVKVNVVDSTDSAQIQTIYNQAVQQGSNFVVGPLAKPQVQAVAQANNTSVPTLALNYLDTDSSGALYQFGLSPLDEARQVAQLAHQSGKQNALIMVPEGEWGKSVADAFQSEWQKQGGTVASTMTLSNTQAVLVKQIKQLAMQQRGQQDVILLAASPTVARQIKPLLKFYRSGDLPIYATSMIYNGVPKAREDHDLNGITFCDAPWAIAQGPDADVKQKLASTYSANFQSHAKLYGLGVDAYHVMMQFKSMTGSQQTLVGATGTLSFNGHRIVRQLTCAQFRDGVPVVL